MEDQHSRGGAQRSPIKIPSGRINPDERSLVMCKKENFDVSHQYAISTTREGGDDVCNGKRKTVYDDEEAYLDSFPPGYRFKPRDDELIYFYLATKINSERLPPNKIKEVELYKADPDQLASKHQPVAENEWYFFTPRDRKYKNGERPNRATPGGYWKATGSDKPVKHKGQKIGSKKSLVFYNGKPQKSYKTDWIMHEYGVINSSKRKKGGDDMRLDDWVLCRIHKKVVQVEKSSKMQAKPKENKSHGPQSETSIPVTQKENISQDPHMTVVQGHQRQALTGAIKYSPLVPRETRPTLNSYLAGYEQRNLMLDQSTLGGWSQHQYPYQGEPHMIGNGLLPALPESLDFSIDPTSPFVKNYMSGYDNPIRMTESTLPVHQSRIRQIDEQRQLGKQFNDQPDDDQNGEEEAWQKLLPPPENYDPFDDFFPDLDDKGING